MSTRPAYTHFSACLHGIDAGKIRLRRDERHNALYLELDDDVYIRLDLDPEAFGRDRTDEIGHDRDGLLRLAEVTAPAAQELGQLLGLGGDEDQAAEDTRRLDRIRGVLAKFDWERDDHQHDDLWNYIDGLREDLGRAEERIAALEQQTPQARQLQLEADQAAADLRASRYVEGLTTECRDRWHDNCPPAVRCDCECHLDDEDQGGEPEPGEYDPGPGADDEGGMSEYRGWLP